LGKKAEHLQYAELKQAPPNTRRHEGKGIHKNEMEHTDYISYFFDKIKCDPRISITHIGIYAALLKYWVDHGKTNPFYAFGQEIMTIAKISAPTTYHKIVKELNDYGYIRYEPSFKKNRGSRISLQSQNL